MERGEGRVRGGVKKRRGENRKKEMDRKERRRVERERENQYEGLDGLPYGVEVGQSSEAF
jgi:hypothetical protein